MIKYIRLVSISAILVFTSLAHASENGVPGEPMHLASTFANIAYQGEYVADGGCCAASTANYEGARYKHHYHHKKHHKHKHHHKQHKKHHHKHYKKRKASYGCG